MVTKNNITVAQIKEEIEKLKGKNINMSINQGRKRFANFEGVIQDTYNSIFVVKLTKEKSNAIKKLDAMKGEILKPDQNNRQDVQEEVNKPKNGVSDLRTYSYIDILCGNVDIDGFMQKIK